MTNFTKLSLECNLADVGTRLEIVSERNVGSTIVWKRELPWMRDDAVSDIANYNLNEEDFDDVMKESELT